jgi:hypothetical protein
MTLGDSVYSKYFAPELRHGQFTQEIGISATAELLMRNLHKVYRMNFILPHVPFLKIFKGL